MLESEPAVDYSTHTVFRLLNPCFRELAAIACILDSAKGDPRIVAGWSPWYWMKRKARTKQPLAT